MQKNKEIMSWLKNTWTKHRDKYRTIAGMMTSDEKKQENNFWQTPDGWKEYLPNGIIREDNKKLEPRNFERTDKI